jgi:hypothetical protein
VDDESTAKLLLAASICKLLLGVYWLIFWLSRKTELCTEKGLFELLIMKEEESMKSMSVFRSLITSILIRSFVSYSKYAVGLLKEE